MWRKRDWMQPARLLTAGALTLCLMSASGCSAPVPAPRVYLVAPPEDLMQATQAPAWVPRTNGELLRWAVQTDQALMECNADKASLREYVRTMKARGH